MKDFLSAREINILEEAHRAAQQTSADRIKTILLLNDGYTYETISHILRLDNTSIRRYEKEYKKSGLDGLLEDHYHGSAGRLTNFQEIELSGYLKTHLHQTAKEIRIHIEKTYKVNYSVEGVTQLLHRLNFVYKKTKIVPGKVNPGLQRCFDLIKKDKEPDDRIYFLDGTHPVHNNRPCYGWIYKGEVKTSPGNSGRKRLNLNGALNLENMDITVLEEKTINTEAMIRLFTELERKQEKVSITAIVDKPPTTTAGNSRSS